MTRMLPVDDDTISVALAASNECAGRREMAESPGLSNRTCYRRVKALGLG